MWNSLSSGNKSKTAHLLLPDILSLLGLVDDQWWWLIPYTNFCPQSPDTWKKNKNKTNKQQQKKLLMNRCAPWRFKVKLADSFSYAKVWACDSFNIPYTIIFQDKY